MIEAPHSDRDAIASDLMPDLTPLLDVTFMLIVFFILTANAVPYALDVQLPKDKQSVAKSVDNPDMAAVTLLPGEQGWRIGEDVFIEEDMFFSELQERTQDGNGVIIIGDKDVSMQKLMSLMVFLRKHQIETADIMMERE